MGNITVKINDQVENRLREYIWKKWHGKGRHTGEVIELALEKYLNKEEAK